MAGFRLGFSKRSRDGSGKAMLVTSDDPEAFVYGVLYNIDGGEIEALDRAEGRGNGYERLDDFEVCAGDDAVRVTTYMADDSAIDSALKPYDWYLALVVKGAEQHALPGGYIDGLRATISMLDSNTDRLTRKKAVEVLKESP